MRHSISKKNWTNKNMIEKCRWSLVRQLDMEKVNESFIETQLERNIQRYLYRQFLGQFSGKLKYKLNTVRKCVVSNR